MRRTVTITAPNGAKVRTALGKSYYVVRYGDLHVRSVPNPDPHEYRRIQVRLDPPEAFAEVAKRTDSPMAAEREWKHNAQAQVFRVKIVAGEVEAIALSRLQLTIAADAERRHRKHAAVQRQRAI
jgi:hypothetical protein